MADDYAKIGWETIQKAVENGPRLFDEHSDNQDFNKACDHVLVLIEDAFSCFIRASYGTAVFLSITAIEETAKAEIGIYRRANEADDRSRRKDPLFNHLYKHRMAILPTVFMGRRLEKAIGKSRCEALITEVAHGSLRDLREEALYFHSSTGKFVTPKDAITRERAREVLLLAIEAADDRLVGYTGHTGIIEHRLDQIFKSVCNS